jgi:GNAT superfamily N-acetyltransferase
MAYEILELSPHDADPAVAGDRGVSLVAAADRQLHAPGCCIVVMDRGSLVARCSCWWADTAMQEGRRVGVIGHYAAADREAGVALLSEACRALAARGSALAIGPMDGNTWRRYRFIVERGAEPAFFLEPDHPPDWPEHWTGAGFEPLATYTSAVNDNLQREDPRTAAARTRLEEAGITIRAFDTARAEVELRRIFAVSLAAFSRNFFYTPISEGEFLAQNHALLPYVQAELVQLAEREDAIVGFMFALPDMLQARRGEPVETLIMKTLAVHPSVGGIGLGSVLMDVVQRAARERGFRRAIHALIHETNVSRKISDRYAHTIRRYALFSRRLVG